MVIDVLNLWHLVSSWSLLRKWEHFLGLRCNIWFGLLWLAIHMERKLKDLMILTSMVWCGIQCFWEVKWDATELGISLFGFPFLPFLVTNASQIETDLCISTWLFWPLALTQMDWRHPISQFVYCTAVWHCMRQYSTVLYCLCVFVCVMSR